MMSDIRFNESLTKKMGSYPKAIYTIAIVLLKLEIIGISSISSRIYFFDPKFPKTHPLSS